LPDGFNRQQALQDVATAAGLLILAPRGTDGWAQGCAVSEQPLELNHRDIAVQMPLSFSGLPA
jgi:hypothetical protein